MAIYHKDFQYHEDSTSKKELSCEDRAFLLKLQTELNTQDTAGTADPRFWVIKGSETYRNDDEPEEYGLICGGEVVACTTKETLEYLNGHIMPQNPDKDECTISHEESICFDFVLKYKELGEEDQGLFSMEELNEYLSEVYIDPCELFGLSSRSVIYPNTMFLTEKITRVYGSRTRMVIRGT